MLLYFIKSVVRYPTAFRRTSNDERTCFRNCRCTVRAANAQSSWNNNYNSNNKNTHHRRRPTTISTKSATTIARNNPYLNTPTKTGKALVRLCKSVPHGVVVFLPSYKYEAILVDAWKKQKQQRPTTIPVLPVVVVFGSNWLEQERQRSFANQRKHPR